MKTMKKLLSMLLLACMLMSMCASAAYADGPAVTLDEETYTVQNRNNKTVTISGKLKTPGDAAGPGGYDIKWFVNDKLHWTGLASVGNGSDANDFVNSDHYTDPNLAEEFVEGTGCGSLAIAVGNAHGPYVKVPNLDMERIKACREAVSVPLVMHGCSDIPDEQLQEAVNLGMSKFNIATEYFRSMYRAFEKDINSGKNDGNGVGLLMDAAPDMRAFVASKIQLLNPNHYSL